MKNPSIKLALAATALSAATLLPAQAQPVFIIAGSSGLYNPVSYVMSGGTTPLIGQFNWTYKSGTAVSAGSGCTGGTFTAVIHDSRSTSIVDEPGTVTVSWNSDEVASPKGPNPLVAAYINVDSAVGVRAALAVPAASLSITAPAGTCGQNKVPTLNADSPLPAAVLADLNAAPTITLAAADIRAEDAIFATKRTLTAQGTQVGNSTRTNVKGLGYGGASGPSIGFPIKSSQSAATANPVDFAIFGSDPISGQPADANIVELAVGAGPVVVFVNSTNTGTGHFGDSAFSNIDEWSLSGFLDGSFSLTRDAFAASGLGAFPARTFLREPLSGTYNTMEYNIPNTARELSTQENGVTCVTPSCGSTQNPLNDTLAATGGGRSRVIGTGEMVSTVKATADSLGYAFWGYGNFSGIASTTAKYITVNGIDPLTGTYTNGAFPQKSGSTFPVINFPNVANGSYPIWTIYRIVAPSLSSASIAQQVVASAQANAGTISDFLPATSLNVFRSHYFQWEVGGYNGHKAGFPTDSGGDVGGAIFPVQDDIDSIADLGVELLQRIQ